ncbi:MAG: 16S rRNA (cytosine(967)-C(5))-methyltransferase RsmB [Clostridiales bacterium]|nr:16S rRNA (cytosine(967)-C(5))-methyltransferase RsmB [Clostridiales bacterium]
MNARQLAVKLLLGIEDGAYSDLLINRELEKSSLDRRDSAFCTALVLGTLQNRMLLDYYIEAFSSLKMNKISKRVLTVLRISVYQMILMDRVPHNAAVNEAVNIVKESGNNRAASFVNGVLRSISRSIDNLPEIKGKDELERLSIKYSHPLYITKKLSESVEDIESLLKENNKVPLLTVRVNTLKCSREKAVSMLESQEITVKYGLSPQSLKLVGAGDIEKNECFTKGFITVQDDASQLCVQSVANIIENKRVKILDACAAPGGKSFAAFALSGGKAHVTSCDIHEKKLSIMNREAERLGVQLDAMLLDARKEKKEFLNHFDLVMADVPCSGLGVIRKKPDIRYKAEESIERLPQIQLAILRNVSRYVKPSGTLLYSTCTVLREENENVIESFLRGNSEYMLKSFKLSSIGDVESGMITLLPNVHSTDGFFIARLERRLRY